MVSPRSTWPEPRPLGPPREDPSTPQCVDSPRARTGSVAGPVAGLSCDLASGIIGDFAASLVAGISLAAFLKTIFRDGDAAP